MPSVDAELLVRFVPIAFAWPFLKKMGISSFPSTFFVADEKDRLVEMPIAGEHYFLCAGAIAMDITTHGFTERISKATFQSIVTRSADFAAANNALSAGKNLAGGRMSPPQLFGITAEAIRSSRSAK